MDYVAKSYQHGELLLQAIGTFWSGIFGDTEMLKQYFRGSTLEAGQAYRSYLETVASLSRYVLPYTGPIPDVDERH
jgi:hypothetical protein